MAGFLGGLFNYEKEGPGIRKDAPKKKTFIVFFEMFFRNFWKFIPISALYVIISIPVLTNGLANAGITHVMRNTARDKHSFGISDFFETIKKNFRQALILGILNALIFAVLIFATVFYYRSSLEGSIFMSVGFGVALFMLIFFCFMQYYIWTVLITFSLKIKQIIMNSFKLVVLSAFKSILCGVLLLLTYSIYIVIMLLLPYNIVWFLCGLFIFFTLPAYRFLMIQFVAFPTIKKYMIDPYYNEHPDLDIQQRRNLGLYEEPDEENNEENSEV